MASEYNEKLSGKVAIQFKAVLGALVVGAGTTPLTGDAWYKIAAKAASGSTLPLEIDYYFKTPATGQTPTVGDDVYPVTWEKICKADTSFSGAKGAIDVTDDCDEGYNTYITDGFSDLSGDTSTFMRFKSSDNTLSPVQEDLLNKFMAYATDDGAGVYTLTDINDEDIFLAILQNSNNTAEGFIQQWLMVPAMISSLSLGKPLKSGQNFDYSWQKGLGPAFVYKRTTNATETVF